MAIPDRYVQTGRDPVPERILVHSRVYIFAIVTLIPVGLLSLGGLFGGVWILLALIYLTVFAFTVDELGAFGEAVPGADQQVMANVLSVALAIAHFGLLALAVWALAGNTMVTGEKLAAFFAFGLFFGQVSNANAHELIHRRSRALFLLGKWVFISHLFGHHASAHRLVHHVHVATDLDPNSAPLGMGFYRFAPRAWGGSFRLGLRAETARRLGAAGTGPHPYTSAIAGGLVALGLAAVIGGPAAVLAYVGLAAYASMQLLLSDYVQHYGLRRGCGVQGRPEPVGPQHSWNAPHRFSSLLMLNAPRHSDHHDHPGRSFVALVLPEACPTLPHSLAVMGMIALWPRRWRRLMDARVAMVSARGR